MDSAQLFEQIRTELKKDKELDEFAIEQVRIQEQEQIRQEAVSRTRADYEKGVVKDAEGIPVVQEMVVQQDDFGVPEEQLVQKEREKQLDEVRKNILTYEGKKKKDIEKNSEQEQGRHDFIRGDLSKRWTIRERQEFLSRLDAADAAIAGLKEQLRQKEEELKSPGAERTQEQLEQLQKDVEALHVQLQEKEKIRSGLDTERKQHDDDARVRISSLELMAPLVEEGKRKSKKQSDFEQKFMMRLIDYDPKIALANAEEELFELELTQEDFAPEAVITDYAGLQEKLAKVKSLCYLFATGSAGYEFLTPENKAKIQMLRKVMISSEGYVELILKAVGIGKETDEKGSIRYVEVEKEHGADVQRQAASIYANIKAAFAEGNSLQVERIEEHLLAKNEAGEERRTTAIAVKNSTELIRSIPIIEQSQLNAMGELEKLYSEKIGGLTQEEDKNMAKTLFVEALNTMSAMTGLIRKVDALDGFRKQFADAYMMLLSQKVAYAQTRGEAALGRMELEEFRKLNADASDAQQKRLEDEAGLIESGKKQEKEKVQKELRDKYAAYTAEREEEARKQLEDEIKILLEKAGKEIDKKATDFESGLEAVIKQMDEDASKDGAKESEEAKKKEEKPSFLDVEKTMGLYGAKEEAGSALYLFNQINSGSQDDIVVNIGRYEESFKRVFGLLKTRSNQLKAVRSRFALLHDALKYVLNGGESGLEKEREAGVKRMLAQDYKYKNRDVLLERKLNHRKTRQTVNSEFKENVVDKFGPLNDLYMEHNVEKIAPVYDLVPDKGIFVPFVDLYQELDILYKQDGVNVEQFNQKKNELAAYYMNFAGILRKKINALDVPDDIAHITEEQREEMLLAEDCIRAYEQIEIIVNKLGSALTSGDKEKSHITQILKANVEDRYRIIMEGYEAGLEIKGYLLDSELAAVARKNKVPQEKLDDLAIYRYVQDRLNRKQINETRGDKAEIAQKDKEAEDVIKNEHAKNEKHKAFWEVWDKVLKEYDLEPKNGVMDAATVLAKVTLCETTISELEEQKKQYDAPDKTSLDDVAEYGRLWGLAEAKKKELTVLKVAYELASQGKINEEGTEHVALFADMAMLCTRAGLEDVNGEEIKKMFWDIAGIVNPLEVQGAAEPKEKERKERGLKVYKSKMYTFYEGLDNVFGHTMPAIETLIANDKLMRQVLAAKELDKNVAANKDITLGDEKKDELLLHRVSFFSAISQLYQLVKDELGIGVDISEIRVSEKYQQLKEIIKTEAGWFAANVDSLEAA